jgi:HK97 gp10 family phage protein
MHVAVIRTISEFRAAMARVEARVRKAAVAGLVEATRFIADQVRDATPKDTGELADTVEATRVEVEGDRLTAEVVVGEGLDSPHVASEEYGNAHQVARPFIRPAFRQAKPHAREIVARHLRKSL